MRNDNHKWPPVEPIDARSVEPIELGSVLMTPIQLRSQTLISGPKVLTQVARSTIGWPDIVDSVSYTLCLRRDRVLVVDTNNPNSLSCDESVKDPGSRSAHSCIQAASGENGWDETNQQAISDVSDIYQVFDLSGTGVLDLLQRGAELTLATPSKSVMRLMFGMEVMVYRVSEADRFRIHVSTPRIQNFTIHLRASARFVAN